MLSYFYTDDFEGGKIAASYLLKYKIHKIAYVYEKDSESSYRREKGFLEGLKNNKIEYRLISSNDFKGIEEAVKEGFKGFFFYNDEVISRAMKQNTNLIKLFRKCTLIGYDNSLNHIGFNHRFASIDYDYNQIADDIVGFLFKKIYLSEEVGYIHKCYDVYLKLNKEKQKSMISYEFL